MPAYIEAIEGKKKKKLVQGFRKRLFYLGKGEEDADSIQLWCRIRKQNIPIRQTMEIYRSAVSYLTEIYAQVWEELAEIPETKSVLMLQSIWYIRRKKTRPGLILTFVFRRCRLISEGRRSSMHWEVYLRIRPGWNSGKNRKAAGKPRLVCENHAMPVFYRDVMYREEQKKKMRHI